METKLLNGIEKYAVTLSQLRKATDPLKQRLIKSRAYDAIKGKFVKPLLVKQYWNSAVDGQVIMPLAGLNKQLPKILKRMEVAGIDVSPLKGFAKAKGKIIASADPYKYVKQLVDIKKLKTPVSREAFNRSMLLHEASEIGKHPGKYKAFSHLSLKPIVNDLNIAATLKGPGSGAAGAIKNLRQQELDVLQGMMPGIVKLKLGEERISRHALRGLQRIYDKKILETYGENVARQVRHFT